MVIAALASVVLELAGAIIRPTTATCPPGSWLSTGVQPDGAFACRFDPLTDDGDAAPRVHPPRGVVHGRVWCSGAMYPRVDGVRVWCAAGRPTS